MAVKIGIIAEDNSDVEVAAALIRKLVPSRSFAIRSFVGHGCGKLRSKCPEWAEQLRLKGCSLLLVIHDLDDRNLTKLKNDLEQCLNACQLRRRAIVIPIREIEAWLLCDPEALKRVFRFREKPKVSGNPENILDPKRKLEEIVQNYSKKKRRYINAVHNQQIAGSLQVGLLRRCAAFLPFEAFVKTHLS